MPRYEIEMGNASTTRIDVAGVQGDVDPAALWAFGDALVAQANAESGNSGTYEVLHIARLDAYDVVPRPA